MTDADQETLESWGGADDDRAAEAEAVAGGDGDISAVLDPESARYPDADGSVELAVTQVDYTVEGSGDEEYPVVHVFGRTAEDDLEHVRVLGVEPYFYVPTQALEADPTTEFEAIVDARETDADGEAFESIRGRRLTKLVARTPRDVGTVREEFEETYEADILFPNRFLIDAGIDGGVRVPNRRLTEDTIQVPLAEVEPATVDATLRVNTFDIEVDDRRGFPEDGEEPIVCLTSHDSTRDEYIAWLYESPDCDGGSPTGLPDYDQLDPGTPIEVRSFGQEAAMLDAFIEYLADTDPDVLTGWNFDDFDAPYLLDRMEVLDQDTDYDLDPDRLSRVDEVWRSGWGGPDIKGRVVFDLLYGYQRTQFSELDSYRLDAVGEQELGVGKERYTGDIGDLWEQDPERLLEYNVRDVELCVEIDRQQHVIEFWDEVRSFVGCKLEDAPTPGDAVDMYVLHKAAGRFALPTKGQQEGEDFEGGAVFDPITGVRENVTVLDLASLYPNCMVTINASPETKVEEDYDGETHRAPNGTRFRAEPDGMMREMVDELLAEREQKKAARDDHEPGSDAYAQYDRQQAAVKTIMNSLYGVSGWERFRLYDKESAAAITATGRSVIEFTEEAANELDKEVIYGDSVTGDRPIVVRDPKGMVRMMPIEDLFERAAPTPGRASENPGQRETMKSNRMGKDRRILDGWEALSVTQYQEPEWRPITAAIRHETDKQVVKLQHKFGESVTTTDHAYVVEDGDGLTEATPEEVETPLRVPDLPETQTLDEIDVYDVLEGYRRSYQDGRSVGKEDAETKVNRIHANDEWVWFGHSHQDTQPRTVKVKRHIDLESEDGMALVRLLAAYITEGSASTQETTNSKFGASISESNREWLEQVQEDYQRLFQGANTSIIESDSKDERTVAYETAEGSASAAYDDQTLKVQMMNELSAVFFREFAGQTSRGKRIPSFIYHLEEDLQSTFLTTLVEGDGSRKFRRYSEEYSERNFDFETTSQSLAAGLAMLLIQRGERYSVKYRDAKDSYTIRTCDYYRSGRDPVIQEVDHDGFVYDLSVEGNQNFVDAVGGIVLHNTDSVMLELGEGIDVESAIEASFEIEDHINSRYDEFAREALNAEDHRFEIEFEKLYRRFFQAGKKKRYAGHIVWKEGKDVDDVDITGFEYKRSDIAPITKEVQREVIEMVVHGEDLDDVTDYVHDVIEDYRAGEVEIEDVGIPGGIGKRLNNYDTDTAHVRGAKYANLLLGTNFQRGSKPKRLYLEKVHPEFFREVEAERPELTEDPLYLEFKRDPDVIGFEYADQVPEAFAVDWEKMLEKTLKGPIERVLAALDVSWEEVQAGQTQTGLGSFM